MTDSSVADSINGSECTQFTGRPLDLCLCEGRDGRPNPTLEAANRWRAKERLPLLSERPKKRASTANAPRRKPDQKFRGLGDVVAAGLKFLRLDKVAKRAIRAVTGKKGCGCGARRRWLNRVVPFGSAGE